MAAALSVLRSCNWCPEAAALSTWALSAGAIEIEPGATAEWAPAKVLRTGAGSGMVVALPQRDGGPDLVGGPEKDWCADILAATSATTALLHAAHDLGGCSLGWNRMMRMALMLREPPAASDAESETPLRPARVTDDPVVKRWAIEFHADVWGAPPKDLDAAGMEWVGDSRNGRVLVLEADGAVAALGKLGPVVEGCCRITGMYVPEANRGRGLGKAVLHGLCKAARDRGAHTICLFCDETSARNLHLYGRIGGFCELTRVDLLMRDGSRE